MGIEGDHEQNEVMKIEQITFVLAFGLGYWNVTVDDEEQKHHCILIGCIVIAFTKEDKFLCVEEHESLGRCKMQCSYCEREQS